MTIAVDLGRKATKQTNKQNLEQSDLGPNCLLNNKQTLSNVVITPHFQILPMSKVD